MPTSTTSGSLPAQTCYDFLGNPQIGTIVAPCHDIPGKVSMCCALNVTDGPGENTSPTVRSRDTCLPNGLCQNDHWAGNGVYDYKYWLEGCTSADWTDCLTPFCKGSRYVTDGGSARLTPCADTYETTKWCCTDDTNATTANNTDCCYNWPHHQDAVTVPLNFDAPDTSTSSTSPSKTSTASTTSATTTSANTQHHDSGLSTGAEAGIAIGVVLAAIVLIGALVAFVYRRRRNRRTAALPAYSGQDVTGVENGTGNGWAPYPGKPSVWDAKRSDPNVGNATRSELEAPRGQELGNPYAPPAELPGHVVEPER